MDIQMTAVDKLHLRKSYSGDMNCGREVTFQMSGTDQEQRKDDNPMQSLPDHRFEGVEDRRLSKFQERGAHGPLRKDPFCLLIKGQKLLDAFGVTTSMEHKQDALSHFTSPYQSRERCPHHRFSVRPATGALRQREREAR